MREEVVTKVLNLKRKPFTAAEAKIIGDKLGIDWTKIDLKQFRMGMNAELVDGTYNPFTSFGNDDDPIKLGKVVRTHLNESADYYTEWAQMEKEAKQGQHQKQTSRQIEAVL